jgi:peptidyl-prolyl cis-trans isomerase A (cyclophilin A)
MPHMTNAPRAPLGVDTGDSGVVPTGAALGGRGRIVAHPTHRSLGKADMADLQAVLKTNRGDITVNLLPNHAPETVDNFVGLAEGTKDYNAGNGRSGPFYDGLGFHRVISGFMIQGGCPLGTGTGGPGYTFKDEPHPELTFDKPYLLAMANAGPGTNGSQFFITVGATPWLNFKHTIFGEVADQASRDVVDAIESTPTGRGDQPVEPVVIEHVEINRG